MDKIKEYIYESDTQRVYSCEPIAESDLETIWKDAPLFDANDALVAVSSGPTPTVGSISISSTTGNVSVAGTAATSNGISYSWIMPVQVREDVTPKHVPMIDLLAKMVRVKPNEGDVDFYDVLGDDLKRYDIQEVVQAAMEDLEFFHKRSKNFPHKP